jgi:hypothetical protein
VRLVLVSTLTVVVVRKGRAGRCKWERRTVVVHLEHYHVSVRCAYVMTRN